MYYVIDYRIDGTRYRKGMYAVNQRAAENMVCLNHPGILHPVEFINIMAFESKTEALDYHGKTGL